MLSFGAIAAASVAAAQGLSGDSPALDVLHYVRCGAVLGVMGGVAGMTYRKSPAPATRKGFVRAVLSGVILSSAACAVGSWRHWDHGLTYVVMALVGLLSEPIAWWGIDHVTTYLGRAADRALPPTPGGDP